MFVARLTDKGTLDKGFGSGGVVRTVPSGRAFGVGVGPGDTVVAAVTLAPAPTASGGSR